MKCRKYEKRAIALPAGVAEEAEQGFTPCVVAGLGAEPHSKRLDIK